MRYKPIYNPKKRISLFAKISAIVFPICLTILVLSRNFTAVADFVNSTVSFGVRYAMAKLFDFLPFSVFEILFVLIPAWIFLIVFLAVRSAKRGRRLRFVINLFSVVLIIFSWYSLTLAVPFNTTTVAERMELPRAEVTEDNLAEIMTALRNEVNELSAEIEYGEGGASVPTDDFREISEKICIEYDKLSKEYGLPHGFSSHAKPVMLGSVMSRFGLTGVYTFFTGEANVNSAYPMYDMTFTAAHELAHQRGIIRENEANFIAYLVCSRSDDAYLRYSAALSMYEYIGSALYRTDRDRYYEIASGLGRGPRGDLICSNGVYEKYKDSVIGDITSELNDAYLKGNGTEGVASYGMVVLLTVSYFESVR